MRIQRLELFGFKSFPDRTTFEFGSGISGVVGPNGSGKSNVVDALRWVIGEQSARSLRGKDMADVIFAGSAARAPVGFAEVALTLSAAEGEPFPGDLSRFEEVEVGRRLYRDGTSEYLMNKVKCRRRDIVDLFMDTGVGANLYSFIAQGQVDRIVSQSPAERRSLIDEAAGISRYKVRRDEALARLAATSTQLDRARDVADEMGRRLRSLEKQVLAAGRFRRVRAQVRQREIALGVVKYAALSEDRRALRNRHRVVKQETGALGRSVERVENELAERQSELDSVAEAVSTWRDQAAELEAQRREAEGATELHRKRHEELQTSRRRAEHEAEAIARRAAQEAESLVGSRAELERVELELGKLPAPPQLEPLEEAARQARSRAGELERAQARVEADRGSLQEQLADLQGQEPPVALQLPELDLSEIERLEASEGTQQQAVVRAQEAVGQARRAQTEARQRIEALRRDHQRDLAAWEGRRRKADDDEQQRRRWLERATRQLAEQREEERRRRERAIEQRTARWRRAIHEEVQLRASYARSSAERARRELQGFGVSSQPVVEARASLERAERGRQGSEEELSTARRELQRRQGRHRALQSEFEALEAARRERLPEEWVVRPPYEASLGAEDPLRVGRPELLSLPRLEEEDLQQPSGHGVWAVESRWVVVDTHPELIRVLQERGPPVALRDGSVRVDGDGYVQLGPVAPDRWSQVRSECEDAAREVEEAQEGVQTLERAVEGAQQAEAEAREHLASAQASFRAAVDAHEVRRLEQVQATHQAWLVQADEGEAAARAHHDRAALPLGPLVAAFVGRRPASVGPRPTWQEPELDREVVDRAEQELEQARLQLDRVRGALAAARASVEGVRRERAALEARHQAAQEAFDQSSRRRQTLTERLSSLRDIEGLEEAAARVRTADQQLEHAREQERQLQEQRNQLREQRASARAQVEALVRSVEQAEADRHTRLDAAGKAGEQAEEALVAAQECRQRADVLAVERGEVIARLDRDRARLDKLEEAASELRTTLHRNLESLSAGQLEEKELATRIEQIQIDVESLRKSLGDRYQVSLPGLLDRLHTRRRLVFEAEDVSEPLVVGEVELEAVEPLVVGLSLLDDQDRIVAMVEELETLRRGLARVENVNLAAEEEYRDLHQRYADLDTQRTDLEESVASLRAAIAKMNRTCRKRFRDAYDRVNEAFQLSYPKLVGGGDARLALTDDEDLLETGVDIFVRPPGKRLQNLTLLSGGEKAMTAIALLLALFQVRPSPFCVLDEVDAPLDEANGARFNEMVREMSKHSQFIVITHNRKTMECADVLYGVTMADPGVSTLVSVALS